MKNTRLILPWASCGASKKPGFNKQAGYSMLELLVAMAIGVLVLGSAITLQVSNREGFKATTSELEMKTSAKMAAEFIGTSLRSVGAMGCRTVDAYQNVQQEDRVAKTAPSYNIVLTSSANGTTYSANEDFNAGHEILGYDANASGWVPAPDSVLNLNSMTAGSDAITLRGGVGESYVIAAGRIYGDTTYNLDVQAGTDISIKPNDYAVASSCKTAEVFRVTSVGSDNIGRAGGNGNAVGELTQEFGIEREGFAELRRVATTSYYIANNARGVPTLYRNVDGVSSPLVEGVEHMMIDYGVEDSAVLRNVANRYLTASAIQSTCDTPLSVPLKSGCLWPNVVSLRVSFIMRSRDEIFGKNVTKTYTLPGAVNQDYNKADKYTRAIYSSTFVVRNRLIGARTNNG
ncbi:MAG TPA: prepilin-type N-terminal cleavage/methylation domain-containing protein [Gammaproteobacteria bacterium]|nr:prepilin-type N-terminal cleavage/methylation domain-containing protein [Gammaproteobacteria bacterium]